MTGGALGETGRKPLQRIGIADMGVVGTREACPSGTRPDSRPRGCRRMDAQQNQRTTVALTRQIMADEQRRSVALEYPTAFDKAGVTSDGDSVLDLFAEGAQVYFSKMEAGRRHGDGRPPVR